MFAIFRACMLGMPRLIPVPASGGRARVSSFDYHRDHSMHRGHIHTRSDADLPLHALPFPGSPPHAVIVSGTPITPDERLTLSRVDFPFLQSDDRLQGTLVCEGSAAAVIALLDQTLVALRSGALIAKDLHSDLHWRIFRLLQEGGDLEMMACFQPGEVLGLFYVCGLRDHVEIDNLLTAQLAESNAEGVLAALKEGVSHAMVPKATEIRV